MTVSVLIPVCNGSRTIQGTIDSVLQQTLPADEILVMDDGSTDDTLALLQRYRPRLKVFRQENKGVAAARNALCAIATGDLIAFLDSDDLWHPRYLDHQVRLFTAHPTEVAFFAGHVVFCGYGDYIWNDSNLDSEVSAEILDSLTFFESLNTKSGFFFPSFLCVPRAVLTSLGGEPFPENLCGVDDGYFCSRLALVGRAVLAPTALVAYRVHNDSISDNILKMRALAIECYEALDKHYRTERQGTLYEAFKVVFASGRRQYAKRLMGVGRTSEARRQVLLSLFNTNRPVSLAKSLGLLLLSFMPTVLQPKWPPPRRQWHMDTER